MAVVKADVYAVLHDFVPSAPGTLSDSFILSGCALLLPVGGKVAIVAGRTFLKRPGAERDKGKIGSGVEGDTCKGGCVVTY